jgi:hypothetical protein
MKGSWIGGLVLLMLALLGGRWSVAAEVVVYTSEDQVFSEPVLKAFEAKTGIAVKAVYDTEETNRDRQRLPMNPASSAHRCHRGAERIASMNPATSNGSNKTQALDINACPCRTPERTRSMSLQNT